MNINEIIVSLASLIGIIFTYWFFFTKKEEVVSVDSSVSIIVDGGYQPEVISIPSGKSTKINFIRKDPSSCLEEVIIPDFKIRKYLPMNEKVTIELAPKEAGTFTVSCGMNMFHGKIIVV